jgi:type IV pilus assembly protein PilW
MSADRFLPRRRVQARVERGLSIVELMVGIVIAMLVGLAAAASAVMFGAVQRQGVGTGGALVNASAALAALKDEATLGGLGFFGDTRFLCNKLNLSVGATVSRDNADFTPVQITRTAGQDTLDVFYGDQVAAGSNVLVDETTDGKTGAFLMSLLPVTAGQAILLAPKDPGDACVVRSVTAVTASTDDTAQYLAFGNTGTHNQKAFTTNPSYVEQSRVALLGNLRWTRFRLDGTDLVMERPLEGSTKAVLARNVVAFKVQYGVAAVGATALAEWVDATGDFASIDANEIKRVRALRVGLLTRSPQREKPNADGNCEATAEMPKLMEADTSSDVTDWKCFRYRSSVSVIPLQNYVMGVAP